MSELCTGLGVAMLVMAALVREGRKPALICVVLGGVLLVLGQVFRGA